jgi:hypothetical protein
MKTVTQVFGYAGAGALLVVLGWAWLANRQLTEELREAQAALRVERVQRKARATALEPSTRAPARGVGEALESSATPLKLWSTPEERAAQFDQTVLETERRYGRFFIEHAHDWPPEKAEALKRQLALHQMAVMRALMPKRFPVTSADREAHEQEVLRLRTENEQELRRLLGENDYADLDAFEKASVHRETVSGLTNAMRARGVAVSAESEQVILSAYAMAIEQAAAAVQGVDPSRLTDAERAAFRSAQRDAVQRQLLRELSGSLEAQQLNALLESHLEQEGGG